MDQTPATIARTRHRRPFSLPLQLLFALSVVTAMGLLAATLIWQGWTMGREALLTATGERALNMARLIGEKTERRVAPASVVLSYLAQGSVSRIEDEKTLLADLPGLKAIFDSLPFLSGVIAGFGDGNFFMMQKLALNNTPAFDAPPGAAFVVEVIGAQSEQPRRASFRFYDPFLKLIETREITTAFDPRSRPWYTAAVATQKQHLTDPYTFFASQEIGVTLSEKMTGTDGVIGLDVALSHFEADLKLLLPTPSAQLAILTDGGAVISYVGAKVVEGPNNVPPPSQQRLVSFANTPALAALIEQHAPMGDPVTFSVGGEPWIGVTLSVGIRPGAQHRLFMATPEREILSGLRGSLYREMWLAGGVTCALLLIGGWGAACASSRCRPSA